MITTTLPPKATIELRDYQKDILAKVVNQFKEFLEFFSQHTLEEIAANEPLQQQLKRLLTVLVVLPTGGGKTIIFSACEIEIRNILKTVHDKALNTLIIAHRQELLTQARDKYHMLVPDMPIGLVGDGVHEYGHPITVASIQTISQPKHINILKSIGYHLIIIDEAHHSQANTYQKVLQALPNAFVLMVTATPDRLDGKPIIEHSPLCNYSILDMIAQRHLCNLTPIAVRTQTKLDKIDKTAGDYNNKQLAEAVDNPRRNQRIAEAYMEHAAGRQFLCFSVTVAHAYNLAKAFKAIGVRAEVVSGETPSSVRAQLLKDYESNIITGLVNCGVLTEGYDNPSTSCIIMARPTQSRALFVQCIGRGLRLAPGKDDCILLDITDNVLTHSLEPMNLSKVLNRRVLDKESILDMLEREEDGPAKERMIYQARREKDVVLSLFQKFEWKRSPDTGYYVMEVRAGARVHRIALIPDKNNAGAWQVAARLAPDYDMQWWQRTPMPLDWAQQYAEGQARRMASDPGAVGLIDRKAPWRVDPVSPAQMQLLMKRHIPFPTDEEGNCTWTKGQASDAISKKFKEDEERRQAKKQRETIEVE